MAICISHSTAFLYWRRTVRTGNATEVKAGYREVSPIGIPCYESSADMGFASHVPVLDAPTVRELQLLEMNAPLSRNGVLHISVPGAMARRRIKGIQCHVCRYELPSGSHLSLGPNVAICAPELTFLQVADTLRPSIGKLILAGCELCGTYAIVSDGKGASKLLERAPHTNAASIDRYLDNVASLNSGTHAIRAIATARRAAKHVLDGAASPMEAKLAMLLSLPLVMGGLALPAPRINCEVQLNRRASRRVGKSMLRADLYWPQARLAVEYDSDEHHTGHERIVSDTRRREALGDLGIRVMTATSDQVYDSRKTLVLYDDIRKVLKLRKPRFTRTHVEAREKLRFDILGSR